MLIISATDNEKNRWMRNAKKKKKKKNKKKKVAIQAVVKGWELNDFVVRLSLVFSN